MQQEYKIRWDGVGRCGTAWDGVGRRETAWDGMGQDRLE